MKKKIIIKPPHELRRNDVELEEAIDAWINDDSNTPNKNLTKLNLTSNNSDKSFEKNKSNSFIHDNSKLIDEEYRFTIVIPLYLHRRIKKKCAIEGISMKDVITQILLKEFPEL